MGGKKLFHLGVVDEICCLHCVAVLLIYVVRRW
jgi:hypothetical protein